MDCSTPGLPVLHCLPQFAQTHVRWVRNAVQPSRRLSSPSSPDRSLSQHQGLFFSELALHIKWPRYWSFSISPSDEGSGLTSFRIDWFYLLKIQGTLKSLLQHHSSNTSIFSTQPPSWSSSHICTQPLGTALTHVWPREKSQLWLEAVKSGISFPFSFGCLSKFLFHHVQVRLFHDSFFSVLLISIKKYVPLKSSTTSSQNKINNIQYKYIFNYLLNRH